MWPDFCRFLQDDAWMFDATEGEVEGVEGEEEWSEESFEDG